MACSGLLPAELLLGHDPEYPERLVLEDLLEEPVVARLAEPDLVAEARVLALHQVRRVHDAVVRDLKGGEEDGDVYGVEVVVLGAGPSWEIVSDNSIATKPLKNL